MQEENYYEDDRQQQDNSNRLLNTPFSNPMSNFGSSIILLTNPDDELREVELKLRGLKEFDDGSIKKVQEPLLNDLGVNEIINISQSIIARVTTLSNLEDKDINIHTDYLADTLARLLMINRIRYNIRYPESTRDLIYHNVIVKARICMKRALNEGERRFWKGSQQEITMRQEQKQGNSGGITSKLLGWVK